MEGGGLVIEDGVFPEFGLTRPSPGLSKCRPCNQASPATRSELAVENEN